MNTQTLITIAQFILELLVALLGGFLAAKVAAKSQMLTTAQTSFVEAKLDAFRDFETAFEKWCVDKDRAACANMYRQGNAVCLVANDDTCESTLQLLDLIRKFETDKVQPDFDEISSIHVKLLFSMRKDLLSYPVPKPIKK